MFLHPLYNAFGLDISDLSIKLVQLRNKSFFRSKPSFSLIKLKSINIPPGLIVNGELIQPEEVRKQIIKLLGREKGGRDKVKGNWVVSSIPEYQSAIKLISTDKLKEEITNEEIYALAKKHIPFDDGTYYLDWQWVPKSKNECCSLLMSAAPKKISDSYTYLLESLGLGVVALEVESVAITRAMITAGKNYEDESRIVLDIGATGTSAIVFDNDTIQFSTSLPFSGELLTTIIEQKSGISHEEAEKQKITNGLNFKKGSAWTLLASTVDELVSGIKKTMDFYYSHFENYHQIKKIILSGGGAKITGLQEILSEKTGVEVVVGNPWKNISQKNSIPAKNSGLEYATAIGLALAAADNPLLKNDSI